MKGFCWKFEDAVKEMSSRTIVFKKLIEVRGLRFQFHQKIESLYFRFAEHIYHTWKLDVSPD